MIERLSRVFVLCVLGLLCTCSSAAASVTVTEFAVPTPSSGPNAIVAGPDGALWFTEFYGNKIGRITTSGEITEFALPTPRRIARGIAAGPDGALWFTESGIDKIGRITISGDLSELPPYSGDLRSPHAITVGPDGALWFTEPAYGRIGRITTAGSITHHYLGRELSGPGGITTGPDGAIWFVASNYTSNRIGRITMDGEVTSFPVPTPNSGLRGIAAGPDGALWFTEAAQTANKIGRVTTDGTFSEFRVPTPSARPAAITTGPDGAIWFVEQDFHKIGRVTTDGTFSEYRIPTPGGTPMGLTAGPDGALWFTEFDGNKIGRITVPERRSRTKVTCSPPTVVAGRATDCVAVVSDADAGLVTTPTGTVRFTSSGDGDFDGTARCVLDEVRVGEASCQVTYTPRVTSSTPIRSDTITAEYEGGSRHAPDSGSTSLKVLSISLLSHGAFVIGDREAALGAEVTFWGARWRTQNTLSGGPAPPAFRGFAGGTGSNPPQCGDRFVADPGSSSEHPQEVPELMAVIAAGSIDKAGSTLVGDSPTVVVVRTDPPHRLDSSDGATGTVVGLICGGARG